MATSSKKTTIILLSVSFILAFCSFGYQFLISKTLLMMTQKAIFSISLTTGFFILGLGVAARKYRLSKTVTSDPFLSLYKVEWFLSVIGAMTPLLLMTMFYQYRSPLIKINFFYNANQYIFFYIVLAQIFSFIIGYISGFEIPLVNQILKRELSEQRIYQVLGVTALGGLAAALAINLFFIPQFDLIWSGLVLGVMNFIVCFWVFVKRRVAWNIIPTVVLFLPLSFFVYTAVASDYVYQTFLKSFYTRLPTKELGPGFNDGYWSVVQSHPPIERIRTLYQYVDIVRDAIVVEQPKGTFHLRNVRFVALDGQVQFAEEEQAIYHDLMAHVVFSTGKPVPEKVLILGAGDGLLARELLRYEQIKHIHQVELDPMMVHLANTHDFFVGLNNKSLQNPRVEVTIGDAAKYLMACNNEYEAIFIDFPFPNTDELSKLYSREFYKLVARCLTPTGSVVLDFPVKSVDGEYDDASSIFLKTLKAAGFNNIWPYGRYTYPFILAEKTERPMEFKSNGFMAEASAAQFRTYDPDTNKIQEGLPVNSLFKPQLLGLPSQEKIFSKNAVNR